MKWHILGAGSIGGMWASYLAQAGYEVTLLLKDQNAATQFYRSSLRLEIGSEVLLADVNSSVAAECEQEIEWLLVTTKSFSTLDALETVDNYLAPNCAILLLQNGIGNQQAIVDRYPNVSVVAGVTTDGAYRRNAFDIVHASNGKTMFGSISPSRQCRLEDLQRCFDQLQLEINFVNNIWPEIWEKLAINCCINPLTALQQCRNGELLDSADNLDQIRALVVEIQDVMQAINLGFTFPDLYDRVITVIEATAENYSSMYADVQAERKTEIEQINGFICQQGDKFDIETPANRAVLKAIVSKTNKEQ